MGSVAVKAHEAYPLLWAANKQPCENIGQKLAQAAASGRALMKCTLTLVGLAVSLVLPLTANHLSAQTPAPLATVHLKIVNTVGDDIGPPKVISFKS